MRSACGDLLAHWTAGLLCEFGARVRRVQHLATGDNAEHLDRVTLGAIGCTSADLRPVELAEVETIIAATIVDPSAWRFRR